MKKIRYICLFFLMVFSFYYTYKISDIIINNTYLMKDIKKYAKFHEIKPINAIIKDGYIIPGLNGQKVDYKKSYYNMRNDHSFTISKLVYKDIKPSISINNHKNLVINKGLPNKSSVAIIYSNNKYLKEKNIKTTNINNLNDNICFIINEEKCPKRLFQVTYTYKINNYLSCKNKINAGDIIYIDDYMKEKDINFLLNEIAYHDLEIDYVENVISESR